MISLKTADKGRWAETYALQYLQDSGLKKIAGNYRCRWGEIDIICRDRQTVVFVEVRYRADTAMVEPEETVTPFKQRRIIKAALHYLQRSPAAARGACRFDVVAVVGTPDRPSLTWYKSAFQT